MDVQDYRDQFLPAILSILYIHVITLSFRAFPTSVDKIFRAEYAETEEEGEDTPESDHRLVSVNES